ncbi:hypothetical protein HNQ02_001242 [Flavobacterium sp. 7E]|nr:hypothetical protein [Flavobacterium sp. PL002]NRS88328.1 hypothetical protein [Flavobacterium sp. 7E]NRT15493.1 hypothetical protein [Flavobacterium sp. 28A]
MVLELKIVILNMFEIVKDNKKYVYKISKK